MDMPSSGNVKKQQEYVNRTWNKEDLGNLWESLFDYDRLSKCRQNDSELQSAAILLKKTFHLFKGLRQRCDEAEEACELQKQDKCQQCVRLLEENAVQKQKLKNMDDRLKAVARMLNLGGGTEERSPVLKNPHDMQALTQAFLGADPAATDDSVAKSPSVDSTCAKRSVAKSLSVDSTCVKRSVAKSPSVDSTCVKRSVAKSPSVDSTCVKRSVALVSPARSPRRKRARWRDSQHDDIPETVPSETRHTRRNIVIPETLCESQCRDREDSIDLDNALPYGETQARPINHDPGTTEKSKTPTKATLDVQREHGEDVNETLIEEDPDVTQTVQIPLRATSDTPLKQNTPEVPFVRSPVIGRSSSKRSRSFRRYANLTQSAEVVSLDVTPDNHKLNDSRSPLSRLAMSVGVPRSFDETAEPGLLNKSPKNAGDVIDVSLDESPSILSNVGTGRGNTSSLKNKVKENVMDVSHISELGKGIKKGNLAKDCGKVKLGERKQADYWQLQPTTSVQSVTITGKGSKLKQTKLSLGVFPKKTDLSSLSEFNGGVRPSQSQARREFERGVTLTSTLVEDKRIASDLLEGLNDSDFLSPSPKVTCSLPRRCADSLANKTARKLNVDGTVNDEAYERNGTNVRGDKANTSGIRPLDKAGTSSNLPRNKDNTSHVLPQEVNAEDLLDEMGIPETPRTKELVQSFDKIPNKNKNEPNFKYKGDAVRKKDERMRLEGWDCHECKEFFEAAGVDATKQKMLMNKCSRHRDKNERVKSPDRYWEVGFPTTQECRERNLNITQSGKPLRARKKKTDNAL